MTTVSISTVKVQHDTLKHRMQAWAREAGFELGTYGCCTHRKGLPSYPDSIVVRPHYSPHGQGSLLLVTPNRVERYCIGQPYNYATWMYAEGRNYETLGQLVEILTDMIDPPSKAWS